MSRKVAIANLEFFLALASVGAATSRPLRCINYFGGAALWHEKIDQ